MKDLFLLMHNCNHFVYLIVRLDKFMNKQHHIYWWNCLKATRMQQVSDFNCICNIYLVVLVLY